MSFKALKQVQVFIAQSKNKEGREKSYHVKGCPPPHVSQSGYWTQTPQHPLPTKKKKIISTTLVGVVEGLPKI